MAANPFAEPGDGERTIIRPRPGGAAREPAPEPASADAATIPRTGPNPLIAAAAPVLAAAVRIAGGRGRPPDPEALRAACTEAIRRFETAALTTGLDIPSLRAGRYALCATIDDLVLNTPWGGASGWATQSLTSIFHHEVTGGERFFEILEQMQQDLGRRLPVVELMYVCVSIGFEGRYRVLPRGTAALAELRDSLYRTIRQRRGEFERELSPHWRGVAAPATPLSRAVPPWAMALGTLAVAAAMYVGFTLTLARSSDGAFAELSALPPRGPPEPAQAASPPADKTVVRTVATDGLGSKLRRFLEPDIEAGLVQVIDDPQAVTVRLTDRSMFGSGAAVLGASSRPLLARIGEALREEPGAVLVAGYTDGQAIRTVRFPSNFELSQARAEAVAAVLRPLLADAGRLRVKGKGDADPIASNATPEGRQRNRRTEIVVVRPASAS